MTTASLLVHLSYILAAVLFIFGIKMLGKAETARRGNALSSLGMLLAVVVTLIDQKIFETWTWIAAGIALGALIGILAARLIKMTAMPEMVALFNGFGGASSLLVGWAEYDRIVQSGWDVGSTSLIHFHSLVVYLAILIGGITFTGSVYAYGKLSGKLGGKAFLFPGQWPLNIFLMAALIVIGLLFTLQPQGPYAYSFLIAGIILSLLLGIFGVMPIGGGDMPVVISLLNSLSGLAAAAAGFVILNDVLIVAGCLVGASGFILTVIMCKSMNRTLAHVLFSGFGATSSASSDQIEGEMKAASTEDAYYVLEAAQQVVIIPGYGMAVAQAQHAVKELGEILEENGAEVRYAIHPVAGRMPGHMNVLLAEADVPYEQLVEMDEVNAHMAEVDVAIVIGANDVVNPAATQDPHSPIYGMPIINAHEAKTVYALKRGQGAGFSGLINRLYFLEKTHMLYGDAKSTVSTLVSEFKNK